MSIFISIKALPHNNNIKGFETAEDITSYLREQFAGLFKQFMLDNKRVKETLIIRDIENTAKTLRELVDYLKEDSQGKDEEINRIIRINHPMVGRLKELLNIHYNIYIEEKRDLEALLKARGYKFNPIEECWERTFNNELLKLFISEDLFENDKLKYIKASDWSDDFIKLEKAFLQKDDDLPF